MMGVGAALITGGSGFIGRHLAARLVRDGWDVTCAGRRNPGVAGVRFVPVARMADDLSDAIQGTCADVLYHLAAYGVSPDDRDPVQTFALNVAGTAAAVQAAAAAGACGIVYAGSCSEYADGIPNVPIGEDYPLVGAGLYGTSKAAGGLWGRALAEHYGLGFVNLRLFGIYGPGEAPHRMLPSVAVALSRGERPRLSSGRQVRDMLHVDDAVEGLVRAGTLARRSVRAAYNLCSGRPIVMRDFALRIANACGAAPDRLDFGALEMRPGEPMWQVGNGAAFSDATGFAPALSLSEGVARAVAALGARVPAEVDP